MNILHPRAFSATVLWTLGLLFLGSVVHATESSLACPDWPTCFGTMVPEMSGGVFWEHLHRLVAGGLLLLWGLGTWLARREAKDRPWVFRAAMAGMVLLLVQSVFGGLTVILRLPDLVSTTHLTLAFAFLILATVLASATGWSRNATMARVAAATTRRWAVAATALIMVQSILGALVRHTDAGMACPDAPLCLGQIVPPLDSGLVALHFGHRVLGVVAVLVVVGLVVRAASVGAPPAVRSLGTGALALVLVQVGLGFASVLTGLAVVPVSLHTLIAASILVVLTHAATMASVAEPPAEHLQGAPAATSAAGG